MHVYLCLESLQKGNPLRSQSQFLAKIYRSQVEFYQRKVAGHFLVLNII